VRECDCVGVGSTKAHAVQRLMKWARTPTSCAWFPLPVYVTVSLSLSTWREHASKKVALCQNVCGGAFLERVGDA